jgi:hypothetical protein
LHVDNDGTLWAEQPMYFQLLFALDRREGARAAASRVEEQGAFCALLKGDVKGALAGGERPSAKSS